MELILIMARDVMLHQKDIIINREKIKKTLKSKAMGYIDLYSKVVSQYGLDISYKGFMSLLSNRSSWKLLYAYAIADALNVKIEDIFEVINVDIEKKKKEKEEWKRKYQR